ncbi:caspase family protein [Streptomyces sp. H27-C3]|uniref:effector-associated domain 2-containing protein n=1 Tax=Streptomyces sp. H27-C3 TaxID=3046305 RepID=UPI0024BB5577|nr:caspase family protein [Streptomyces sp. H27-C3]MDJ0462628.1 caspase family protein [Streptomyces sp. H27-C3]
MRMRALVVGVESYEAGSAWNLDGPVHDALGYASWLRELGLPAESLTLLLSPLDRNRALADGCGLDYRPADRDTVHRVLTRELADERSDWLFVAWSGHGLIDTERSRRLLYADAVQRDLRCLDIEALLALYRSDGAPGHPRQLWLFDACQTHADPATTGGTLRPDPIPRSVPRRQADQHVLFACGPGGTTRNAMRSGVFSAEAVRLLREHPDWRRTPRPLADALRGRFGATTSLWFDGDGDALRTHGSGAAPPLRAVPPAAARKALGLSDRRRLLDALGAVDAMRQPQSRSRVIGLLPQQIAGNVARSEVMRLEILDLVETCLSFRDGLTHLWEAVSLVDPGTAALGELLEVFEGYPEWFTPTQRNLN